MDTAALLGARISVGGFSTGGALSLNKILRDETRQITGGLFLDKDIPLQAGFDNELSYPPITNPKFVWMMESAISFFEREVRGR